mgnify:CR=1 FL=1
MLKNLSRTVRTLVVAGIVVAAVLATALIGSLVLQVDAAKARETALTAAGGGEVVGQEIDREGLWSEYSFDIINGSTCYEVEVNTFGKVTGLESRQGGYSSHALWD